VQVKANRAKNSVVDEDREETEAMNAEAFHAFFGSLCNARVSLDIVHRNGLTSGADNLIQLIAGHVDLQVERTQSWIFAGNPTERFLWIDDNDAAVIDACGFHQGAGAVFQQFILILSVAQGHGK